MPAEQVDVGLVMDRPLDREMVGPRPDFRRRDPSSAMFPAVQTFEKSVPSGRPS